MRKDRIFSLILIVCALFMLIYPFRYRISKTTIEKIQPIIDSYVETENISSQEGRVISRDYGLRSDEYESILLYESNESTEVDEMIVVKVKESSQRQAVIEAMEKRIEKRIKVFEGYGPQQTALLKASEVHDKNGYIVLIISPQAETIWKAIEKVI